MLFGGLSAALCVFAASTQLHTKSQLGCQSCHTVINNWPFVPFFSHLFSISPCYLSLQAFLPFSSFPHLKSSFFSFLSHSLLFWLVLSFFCRHPIYSFLLLLGTLPFPALSCLRVPAQRGGSRDPLS